MTEQATRVSPMLDKISAACRQATEKAIEIARQTGTPVIIWENGKVKEVPPNEIPDFESPAE